MRNFAHRSLALYAKNQASWSLQSVATVAALFALSISGWAFGVAISCFLLAISVTRADISVARDGPPLALFSVFVISGFFNDPRLSVMVGIVALISTPAIAAIGNRGMTSLVAQTMSILVAWLPAGLLTVSLTILANRDRSLVALLLVLIYFHDLGLQLCSRSHGIKRLAPVFALAGTLTLLWAAMQVSVSPIPHEWFWQFGALVGFAMTVSRIFTELLVAHRWRAALAISSYVFTGPIWTAVALGVVL